METKSMAISQATRVADRAAPSPRGANEERRNTPSRKRGVAAITPTAKSRQSSELRKSATSGMGTGRDPAAASEFDEDTAPARALPFPALMVACVALLATLIPNMADMNAIAFDTDSDLKNTQPTITTRSV